MAGNNLKVTSKSKPKLKARKYHFFSARCKDYEEDDWVIKIKPYDLAEILMGLGFYRMGRKLYIQVIDNIAKVVDQDYIIDQFEDWFKKNFKHNITKHKDLTYRGFMNGMYGGLQKYFSDMFFARLRPENEFDFLDDTKDTAYFFYRNKIVQVTAKGAKLISYSDVENKIIWADKILPRDIQLVDQKKLLSGNWSKFIGRVAGKPERKKSLMSIIGYCLHKSFHGKMKAVILTDSQISENANGRTGKTLFTKGLGRMLNCNQETAKTYVDINGKGFDPKDKFRYSQCSLDTKLICLQDVLPFFKFPRLYNDITEGLMREAKGVDPFRITPKILITTNRTLVIDGDSSEDRAIEFEFTNFFSKSHQPQDEYGQWFFSDWKKMEYLKFDNFHFYCVQEYLKNGMQEPDTINLKKRKLLDSTADVFIEFMEDYLSDYKEGEWKDKKEMITQFKNDHDDYERITNRKFNKWIKIYFRYSETWEEVRKKEDETKTNGRYTIRFWKTGNLPPF